jgi:hypothetical protein
MSWTIVPALPLAALALLLPMSVAEVSRDPGKAKERNQPPEEGGVASTCFGNPQNLLYPFANDGSWTLSLGGNDDGSTGAIQLGFSFPWFGSTYSQCWINNNGNVTLDGPNGAYTPNGFPMGGNVMIAVFWSDVDTRPGASGKVWHKFLDSDGNGTVDSLAVTWDNVGRYNQATDRLNTFQAVLTDGSNPLVGFGRTVAFAYDNMCWTTGSSSGGSGGFGGSPATVGGNAGDGINFFQIGRFSRNDGFYDGPFGEDDGVDYLDGRRFACDAFGNCAPCPADLDGNGVVAAEDLAIVLFAWGASGGSGLASDLDRSGTVDAGDLSLVIAAWGECP